MQEERITGNTVALQELSDKHTSAAVAKKLNISRQRWNNYKSGKRDIPKSLARLICSKFRLRLRDISVDVEKKST